MTNANTHAEDPDTRAIADRARMSYDETAEMLAGFRSALRRHVSHLPAGDDGGDGR